MRTPHAIGLVAALMLMACSEMGVGPRQGGTQETLTSASATVEAIDQSTRQVRLRDNADGSSFVVTAGPEVRNLDQVAAGDQVNVDFYRRRHRQHGRPRRHRRAGDRGGGRPGAGRRGTRARWRRRARAWW